MALSVEEPIVHNIHFYPGQPMQIDINALSHDIQYKLISSTVVPRPIALISTYGEETGDNAAPFSFFNAMGENPPEVKSRVAHAALMPGNMHPFAIARCAAR